MALNMRTHEPFRYGLVGSPDIIGILNNGKFVGIECKTGNAKQSEQQKNFEKMCTKFNAIYFVAREKMAAVS